MGFVIYGNYQVFFFNGHSRGPSSVLEDFRSLALLLLLHTLHFRVVAIEKNKRLRSVFLNGKSHFTVKRRTKVKSDDLSLFWLIINKL